MSSAIGILGGLAAAGAAYKEGKRNRAREERQAKFEGTLNDLYAERLKQLKSGAKPTGSSIDPSVSDLPSRGNYASTEEAGPELLNSVPEVERGDELARGGVVGYANGGLVDYNNCPAGERMTVGRVYDFVDSSWQRQSFKK